eukprot:1865941-Prymnesium_polylepis.1
MRAESSGIGPSRGVRAGGGASVCGSVVSGCGDAPTAAGGSSAASMAAAVRWRSGGGRGSVGGIWPAVGRGVGLRTATGQ